MTKAPFPSDQQDKFMLRLPAGMRRMIKLAADVNGRSMNSEILLVLAEHFREMSAEEYLGALFNEYTSNQHLLEEPRLAAETRAQIEQRNEIIRGKMHDVIDGKADPATFVDDILAGGD